MRRVSCVPDQLKQNKKNKKQRRWSEGCWGSSRVALGHRVGHQQVRDPDGEDQGSEFRGRGWRRDQEQSCESLLLQKCRQQRQRGPPGHGWRRDDANTEKYYHTQSFRPRSSTCGSLIPVWGYIFFSTRASILISVWNQLPPGSKIK